MSSGSSERLGWPARYSTEVDRRNRCEHLRRLLAEAVALARADTLLLSGGLDTSILAALAASAGQRLDAVTVVVADSPASDEPFARLVAERFVLEHEILRPELGELVEPMPEVIRLLETFDPMELRNSVVSYVALEAAKRGGARGALTGDAADELFAGYSYMFNMPAEELPVYIHHLDLVMHFTSRPLSRGIGLEVTLPYLADPVRAYALALEPSDLVGERDGQRFGKRILREAFSDVLPPEIAWRVKTPIEHGSGSTGLKQTALEAISEGEFERARNRVREEDGVRLRDREQCFYYRMYREIFPPPRTRPRGPKTCSECQGPVPRETMRYCRICGAYPI